MTNLKAFASCELPVVIASKGNNKPVQVAAYVCKDTDRLIMANSMEKPFSPITGGDLKLMSDKTETISVKELSAFKEIATCSKCGCKLLATPELAEAINHNTMHCVVCNEEVDVDIEDSDEELSDTDSSEDIEESDSDEELEDIDLDVDDTVEADIESEEEINNEIEESKDTDEEDEELDLDIELEESDTPEEESEDELDDAEEELEKEGKDKIVKAESTDIQEDEFLDELEEEDEESTDEENATTDESDEKEDKEDVVESSADSDEDIDSEEEKIEPETEDIEDESDEDSEMASVKGINKRISLNCMSGIQVKDNSIDLVLSNSEDTYYVMLDKKPIATMSKVKASEDIKSIFSNESLLRTALNASLDKGFTKEVKANFGISPINISFRASKAVRQVIAKEKAKLNKEAKAKVENYKDRYNQSMSIASVGVNKGIYGTNNLRDSLVKSLVLSGVIDAEDLVNDAFAKYGIEYIKNICDKAKELIEKTDEARNETASLVETASFNRTISKDVAQRLGSHKPVETKVETANVDKESNKYKNLF